METQKPSSLTDNNLGKTQPVKKSVEQFVKSLSQEQTLKGIEEVKKKLTEISDKNVMLNEQLNDFKPGTSITNIIDALKSINHQQKEQTCVLENALEYVEKHLETDKEATAGLRTELEAVKNENTRLQQDLEKVTGENKELKQGMKKLQTDLNNISKKLEYKETKLSLGQLPYLLEAEIWENVMPSTTKRGLTHILSSMETWLKRNAAEENGKAAKKRWDKLKNELEWDDEDYKSASKTLKGLRVADAHPQVVNLEEAKRQVKEGKDANDVPYVGDVDKELCQKLIDMLVKMQAKNQ